MVDEVRPRPTFRRSAPDRPSSEAPADTAATGEFSAAAAYKKYDVPYHPGALKYFKEHNIEARDVQ